LGQPHTARSVHALSLSSPESLFGNCRARQGSVSWQQRLMAAQLWAGEGAAISHRAAAALWELDGFEPGTVELTVSRAPLPGAREDHPAPHPGARPLRRRTARPAAGERHREDIDGPG